MKLYDHVCTYVFGKYVQIYIREINISGVILRKISSLEIIIRLYLYISCNRNLRTYPTCSLAMLRWAYDWLSCLRGHKGGGHSRRWVGGGPSCCHSNKPRPTQATRVLPGPPAFCKSQPVSKTQEKRSNKFCIISLYVRISTKPTLWFIIKST